MNHEPWIAEDWELDIFQLYIIRKYHNTTYVVEVEIGTNAFHSCRNLKEVIFNDGLRKIGVGAFYNCTSLESTTLPSTVTEISST